MGVSKANVSDRALNDRHVSDLAKFPDENPNPILRISSNQEVLYSNKAGSDLLAFINREENHKTLLRWRDYVKGAFKSRTTQVFDVDCGSRVFSLFLILVKGTTYLNAYGMEITDRVQYESDLYNVQKNLLDTLDSISDGFFAFDDDMRVTFFNHEAEKMLNTKKEDVLGQKLFEAFPEAKGSVFEKKYTLALKKKMYLAFETYFDVEPYTNWYSVRVYPKKNGAAVFFQLTTESKLAEKALLEAAEQWQWTFDSITDLMFMTDTDSNITKANKHFADAVDLPLQEIIGRKCYEVFHKTDTRWPDCPFGRILKDGKPYVSEIGESGLGVPFLVTVSPVFDAKQQHVGAVHIARDISDIVTARRELENKNIALAQVLEQVQLEKEKIKRDIRDNVTEIVLPIIEKIKLIRPQNKYLELLKKAIDEVASSYGSKLTAKDYRLTARELEICSMIKNSLSSKEAAVLLNISPKTVERHRRNIRKKLGISRKKANLATFLQSL
jgi:PAS domain S-box-containing protein